MNNWLQLVHIGVLLLFLGSFSVNKLNYSIRITDNFFSTGIFFRLGAAQQASPFRGKSQSPQSTKKYCPSLEVKTCISVVAK